jgi:hypothetical protein
MMADLIQGNGENVAESQAVLLPLELSTLV